MFKQKLKLHCNCAGCSDAKFASTTASYVVMLSLSTIAIDSAHRRLQYKKHLL